MGKKFSNFIATMSAQEKVKWAVKHGMQMTLSGYETKIPGVTHAEYHVHVSDIIIQAQGVPTYLPGLSVFPAPEQNNVIYVCNEKFMEFPVEMRTAFMEHEVGHVVLGHLDASLITRIIRNVLRPIHESDIEFEADGYAAEQVGYGPYILALKQVLEQYEMHGFPAKGLKRRLHKLIIDAEVHKITKGPHY